MQYNDALVQDCSISSALANGDTPALHLAIDAYVVVYWFRQVAISVWITWLLLGQLYSCHEF